MTVTSDFLTVIPNWLPGWLGAGAAAGGGFGVIKWAAEFIAARIDRRSDKLDSDTRFVIDNLRAEVARLAERLDTADGRIDTLETDLAECHKLHAAAEAEAMRLRAMVQGFGDARQEAARIVSADLLEVTVDRLTKRTIEHD